MEIIQEMIPSPVAAVGGHSFVKGTASMVTYFEPMVWSEPTFTTEEQTEPAHPGEMSMKNPGPLNL